MGSMVECCPCLTANRSRQKGFFVLQRGSLMHLEEIGALMGRQKQDIEKLKQQGISESDIGFALGNGQPLNVVERLLRELLFSAGLLECQPDDVWALASEE